MTRYRWEGGHFVNRVTGAPMLSGDSPPGTPLAMPRVLSDLSPYQSPLGDGVVEGRAARREHLKRNGCREVEPGEFRPGYQSEVDRAARVAAQARMLTER